MVSGARELLFHAASNSSVSNLLPTAFTEYAYRGGAKDATLG